MKITREYCDFCTTEITKDSGTNGFCIEIGYSKGGWGHRQDFIPNKQVEICDKCFNKVKAESVKFGVFINNLY
jgi:hypothetical protein